MYRIRRRMYVTMVLYALLTRSGLPAYPDPHTATLGFRRERPGRRSTALTYNMMIGVVKTQPHQRENEYSMTLFELSKKSNSRILCAPDDGEARQACSRVSLRFAPERGGSRSGPPPRISPEPPRGLSRSGRAPSRSPRNRVRPDAVARGRLRREHNPVDSVAPRRAESLVGDLDGLDRHGQQRRVVRDLTGRR